MRRTFAQGSSGGVLSRQAEPKVAPDCGGITVFQISTSHQPPQQVNLVVRRQNDLGFAAMNPQQASDLVEFLKIVAARPGMFFGKADILLAQVFLSGFGAALSKSFGVDSALYERIAAERGWRRPKATGPGIEGQMLEAGMSDEQVIGELVAIEIEVIKRSTE